MVLAACNALRLGGPLGGIRLARGGRDCILLFAQELSYTLEGEVCWIRNFT